MSKGSTWNIWDLHLHTPFSILNNQYGDPSLDFTWEKYISSIEQICKETGIVAVGITDYFTIDGYKKLLEFQERGRLSGILLIPNIEFRIDKVVYRTKDASDPKRLNLHVLLSPLLTPDQIEEHFLHDLEFVHQQEPFQPANTRKLKISNLRDFGLSLQKEHDNFKGKDPFAIGCMNAIVSSEKVKEQLDSRFRRNYLLVLAEETLPLLDWDSQHHAIRKQLMQMSHAIFSSNEKTREFCLGKTHASQSQFIEEFRSLKPCLWGCDAHGYNDGFLHPNLDRFCWIKGDVSWEGLKQVIYEPLERVAIQEKSPEPTKSTFSLARITIPETIVSDSLSISETDLSINSNLVTLIGGRGSGKTALLDLVASCFPEGEKLAGIQTSFFHRLFVGDNNQSISSSNPIPVTLTLASGDIFAKTVGESQEVLDMSNVVYLTQNHFEEYSVNPDKLNQHIITLVFEHFTEERRQYQALNDKLEEIDRNLEECNLEIEHLSEEIEQRKTVEAENLKSLEGSKLELEQRIAEIESNYGKQADEAKELSELLQSLMERDLANDTATNAIERFRNIIKTFQEEYQNSISEVNAALSRVQVSIGEEKIHLLPAELPDVEAIVNSIEQNQVGLDSEVTTVREELEQTRKRISKLEGLDKTLAGHRDNLSSVTVDLIDLQGRIKETAGMGKRLNGYKDEQIQLFANAMESVVNQCDYLQKMIERFRTTSPVTLENILFDALVDHKDYKTYLQNLAQKLDNRVYSEAEIEKILSPSITIIRNLIEKGATNDQFRESAEGLFLAVGVLKTKKSVSLADYQNAIFSRFFKVGLTIKYCGKLLIELSMGERAIILLKVLLALGDKPLLIDQPEEHLDNRFIYDDLAPAFREAKKRRQILIATHNANLVVNTDAEQIIIAENSGGVLGYKVGTLENLEIRETIKKILEGGDEAFKKREERYGYKF